MLFDQSHHMAELMIEGPDALRMLSHLAINSFANFPVDRAKQFVPCSHDGHVIGDVILFHLAENQFLIVGPGADDQLGAVPRRDRRLRRDAGARRPLAVATRAASRWSAGATATRSRGRTRRTLLEKLNGGPLPDIKFFNMGAINIGGRKVRALRHGMSGAPGLEIWGPYEEGEEIRDTILEAGREFGLRLVGARAYADQHAGIGLDPLAAAGGLHRRRR